MTHTIAVGTAPSNDMPGAINISVQIRLGDVTTIVYSGRHPMSTSVMGVQSFEMPTAPRTIDEAAAQIALNEHNWKESLLAAWMAKTGIDPRDAVLCTQVTRDGHRIWVEADADRARTEDLQQQLTAVTQAAADWARRAGHAERVLLQLQARLTTPDFDRLKDLRQCEMDAQERDDALEGWLRANVKSFEPTGSRLNAVAFLLQRLDALRNSPKD